MLLKLSFQIVAELLSKKNLLDNDDGLGRKDLLRVCGMCLSHFCYYLLAYCIPYDTWVLDACDDYIICSTILFIQTSLEFGKWLIYFKFTLI